MTVAYFQTPNGSYSELAGIFLSEDDYIACLPSLEAKAKESRMIVTESIGLTVEQVNEILLQVNNPDFSNLLREYSRIKNEIIDFSPEIYEAMEDYYTRCYLHEDQESILEELENEVEAFAKVLEGFKQVRTTFGKQPFNTELFQKWFEENALKIGPDKYVEQLTQHQKEFTLQELKTFYIKEYLD